MAEVGVGEKLLRMLEEEKPVAYAVVLNRRAREQLIAKIEDDTEEYNERQAYEILMIEAEVSRAEAKRIAEDHYGAG